MRKPYRSTKTRSKWSARTTSKKTRRTSKWAKRTTKTSAWKNQPKTMPSPYAKAFVAGCKKGQPCGMVITAICKRTGKSFNTVCLSLCKAGLCNAQKFNGQWICWPNFNTRTSGNAAKQAQCNLWQGFIDWCIASGNCTWKTFNAKSVTGSQAKFMKNCRTLIAKQVSYAGAKKVKTAAKAPKSGNNWNWTYAANSYKFPTFGAKANVRRFAYAA